MRDPETTVARDADEARVLDHEPADHPTRSELAADDQPVHVDRWLRPGEDFADMFRRRP